MNSLQIINMLVSAVIMLFELRALMQSTSVDYYHSFTQSVTKLTNPLVNIPAIRTLRVGSFWIAGFVIAFIIALAYCLSVGIFLFKFGPVFSLFWAVFLTIKCFGYLVISILLVQALTSWLEATRPLSYLLSQLSEPFVRPIQRVIPPIGMIDISLMILLLGIYLVNAVIAKVLFAISSNLGVLWSVLC